MKQKMLSKKRKLKEGEIIKLSYDEAFKIMFGNPENIELPTMLLSKILKVKYEDIENKVDIRLSTIPNKTIGEKKTERDVVLSIRDTKESRIILEVNIKDKFYETVINRNLFYLNDVAASGFPESEDYDKLPTTILVNFNNFNINRRDKIIDEYLYRNVEGDILTFKNRIININIAKCLEVWYNGYWDERLDENQKDLIRICALMEVETETDFKKCVKDIDVKKEIKRKMEEVMREMCRDENLIGRYYDKEVEERRILRGIESEMLEKGVEEGKEEIKKEIVKKMYQMQEPLEKIKSYVDLEIDEIEKIIKES